MPLPFSGKDLKVDHGNPRMAERFHLPMPAPVWPYEREWEHSTNSYLQEVSYAYSESCVLPVVHHIGWW